MAPDETLTPSRLAPLIGEWAGTTGTRFMPEDAFETCPVKAWMRWVANDTFVLYEYDGTFQGQAAHGAAFFGYNAESGEGTAAWVDSFHSSAAPMTFKGQAAPGELLNVLGSYGPPEEPWGWQTVITEVAPGEILIEAYNIPPASIGGKYVAIETRLKRLNA